MHSKQRAVAAVMRALIAQGLMVVPAGAQQPPGVETLAEGLHSPRGITVTDDGAVYVAESGLGGQECVTEGEGDQAFEICFGETSTITRIAPDGTVDRNHVEGITSMGFGGEEFTGASDVAVADDGTIYLTVGLGNSAQARDEVAQAYVPAAMLGTVQRVEQDGSLTMVADLARWEADNNPDGASDLEEGSDSNPHALLVDGDTLQVADAGGNSILAVDRDSGDISVTAVLEPEMIEAPPEFGGGEMPMQAVPTSLATSPDGELTVGQLTGFPFPKGAANVYTVDDDGDPQILEEGFSAIMGVDHRGDELFALEMVRDGLLTAFESGDFTGALVRVRPDGSRIAMLRDVLQAPGGLAIGDDGMAYVSNGTVFPEGGSMLRVDLSQAADPATQAACGPDEVEGSELSDITDTTHEAAIVCSAWHGLFGGFDDGTFRPSAPISRAQLASTVARLVEATGTQLPDGNEDAFSDVGGTHAEAIASLAAVEVLNGYDDGTFRPGDDITRAEAASVVVRAYEHVHDDLAAGDDAFTDDDDSTHEPAIDAAHEAGWVNGVGEGRFSPHAEINRGQVASVLAREASTLVDQGLLTLPN